MPDDLRTAIDRIVEHALYGDKLRDALPPITSPDVLAAAIAYAARIHDPEHRHIVHDELLLHYIGSQAVYAAWWAVEERWYA